MTHDFQTEPLIDPNEFYRCRECDEIQDEELERGRCKECNKVFMQMREACEMDRLLERDWERMLMRDPREIAQFALTHIGIDDEGAPMFVDYLRHGIWTWERRAA